MSIGTGYGSPAELQAQIRDLQYRLGERNAEIQELQSKLDAVRKLGTLWNDQNAHPYLRGCGKQVLEALSDE